MKRIFLYVRKQAVSEAVDYCIDNSILEDFLRNNRLLIEENEMLDFTYERRLELATRDAREQGISEKTICSKKMVIQ